MYTQLKFNHESTVMGEALGLDFEKMSLVLLTIDRDETIRSSSLAIEKALKMTTDPVELAYIGYIMGIKQERQKQQCIECGKCN